MINVDVHFAVTENIIKTEKPMIYIMWLFLNFYKETVYKQQIKYIFLASALFIKQIGSIWHTISSYSAAKV